VSEPIAVVDIGSSKIVTLIGEVEETGELKIIGSGVSRSKGLRKGVVVNVEKSVESIRESIELASESSGLEIESVFVGITGEHIKGQRSRGMTPVSDKKRNEVRESDVRKALEQAKTLFIPQDRELLYAHRNSFILDGQRGIADPVGMMAVRLEVDVYLLTAQSTILRNLDMVLEKAKVEPIYYVFQPIAASYATFSEEEMKQGVALLDIGRDTTDLAVWFEGELVHTAVLGIGGDLITSDIAYGLKISKNKAEDLKLKYGVASSRVLSKAISEGSEAKMRIPEGVGDEVPFDRRLFVDIIEARVEELLDFVKEELLRSEVSDKLALGVYLVGGSALMLGMRETVERYLGLPTTVGIPRGLTGKCDFLRSPVYASSVGLLRLAPRMMEELEKEEGDRIRGLGDLFRYFFRALKEFLGGEYAYL